MAAFILRDAKILYEGFDISGLLNSVALAHSSDLQDGSTFAQTTRVMVPGIMDSNVEVNGFHDDTVDPLIFEGVGKVTPPVDVLSLSPDGGSPGALRTPSYEGRPFLVKVNACVDVATPKMHTQERAPFLEFRISHSMITINEKLA